jgi:HupE/UreJ protein
MHPRISRGLLAALTAALLLGGAARLSAHDIPARVTVLAFLKPEGHTLRVIVRVPLEAMRDLEFPLRGPGYLDFARVGPLLPDAARLWIAGSLGLAEDSRPLGEPRVTAARISLPSDRSFESYAQALDHVRGAGLPIETRLVWRQALLDVVLEYSIGSDRSSFSLRPALGRLGLRTTTVLRFLPPGRSERAYQFVGDPGLVRLDPRWHQAALRFVALGFRHILDGMDHLLFVLCLVIPLRKWRPLLAVITAFTLAHSVTLIASTLGLAPQALWFPPLIELLIALSIVYMAFENIVGPKLERRWLLAFGFGLVHGFGFSFFLRDALQFAGAHLATSLLSFNLGVELGQLCVLALAIPLLSWLFRRVVAERMGTILLSALVAHSAWHWMADRAGTLRQYRFEWPALDLALLAGVVRAVMLLVIVGGAGWVMLGLVRRLRGTAAAGSAAIEAGPP